MSEELFKLCKEVYEKTSWEYDPDNNYGGKAEKYEHRYGNSIIYTSDYLLEKLPEWTRVQKIGNNTGKYNASYELNSMNSLGEDVLVGSSDTPLKSLLKLTLALHDAGELK